MRVFTTLILVSWMILFSPLAESNQPCNQLFVARLDYGITDADLREAFESFGKVLDAKVIMDRETGRSRGFGFVTMADCQVAATATAHMNGTELNGREIAVQTTQNSGNSRPDRGGGGYGTGAYGSSGGGYGGGYGKRDGDKGGGN